MMFLLTCDKKLTKSQLSPTHASTKRKITDELKHNAGWYEVREGSPVEVQWAVGGILMSSFLNSRPTKAGRTTETKQFCFIFVSDARTCEMKLK